MNPLSFALLGALCWGIAPLFGKVALLDVSAAAGLIARTFLAGGLVAPWVIYRGGLGYLLSIPLKSWCFLTAEAFFTAVAGDLAYYSALKHGQPAEVNLIISISPFITLILSALIFAEEISWNKLLGGLFICLGVFLVGLVGR
ncbi:Drug/metabolite transporter [Moorella glycerini]|uniref:EamA-like transporter family protein n=1 Tax=Neomoorella stamsii TaxID=1266720 RepID=A0A9X7J2T3_9FIRM|nr:MULTISPECIES: EamA family transporter [Moorella]PRR72809.1 EamA-like transporter family protein [Moorella stamsii]CEP66254.1 Drug/metabolite transporter [Moorella glycerini]CEP68154.1 Drug/metabolite transporter [Moorella glycerini]